jgi:uncharacterized protein with HEPN domain
MRPEERDPAHLWDMIEAARAIVDFTKDLTLEEFLAAGRGGEITRLAVERELEILGEAARRVSLGASVIRMPRFPGKKWSACAM